MKCDYLAARSQGAQLKKLAFLGAALALGAAALVGGGRFGHAADHLDAPLARP